MLPHRPVDYAEKVRLSPSIKRLVALGDTAKKFHRLRWDSIPECLPIQLSEPFPYLFYFILLDTGA